MIGDSALAVIVTAELMRRHPDATEGDLSWMRQRVVARRPCAAAARAGGLPEAMRREAPRAARAAAAAESERERIQAALAEAVIGAAWLDLGPEVTGQAVLEAFAPALDALDHAGAEVKDAKTSLQEEAARQRLTVRYRLASFEGPPHARTFHSQALVGGRELGAGEGPSKQASEQAAAAEALARLREEVAC